MFAIKIANDIPEVWGPYETRQEAVEVVGAYVFDPDTAEIAQATDDLDYTGRPA